MRNVEADRNTTHAQRWPRLGLLLFALLVLCALGSGGCCRLRLPAIDPTGACLFAPKPTSTTFALPGSAGEACLCTRCTRGLKGCLNKGHAKIKGCFPPKFKFPTPAFVEPVDPPPCATPVVPGPPKVNCGPKEACIASQPCNGSCKDGPPAVVYNDACKLKTCLPSRGKRGCILLSPQKVVAPVGGEVVLLSGICGTDGYLQMNERLEWMLTPDSVGTFLQVGDDDPNFLHRLVGSSRLPKKHDATYAHGLTSAKRTLITRGNHDPRDDVQLEKGQTWITISSPSEGTSRVTVLAPDSECWDQRKATTTIYWIDARWQFPGPQIVPAGQPVQLTTRVTRAEGTLPARGWKVRYEILQPELATFAGTGGASVLDAVVDDSGNAVVQLIPTPGTAGTATIDMQVIRPGGESDNMPSMTLGRGQTYVNWSSPQLGLRAGAPPVAGFDAPVEVVVNVSNPGDQSATNVRVDVPIPQGVRVVGADTFATVTPSSVIWEIGTIPAQQQLDLFLTIASQAPVQLPFQATADGLRAEDTVRIDVFRPSLALTVVPERDRYEVGQPVTFQVDLTNTGDRPLSNVVLTANGDFGMVHEEGGRAKEKLRDGNAPLQPGETWPVSVIFVPTEPGQRCISVQAVAAGGQNVVQQGCVTVLNAAPPAQSVAVTLEQKAGRSSVAVGDQVLMTAQVTNTGAALQRDVRVTMVNDPQMQLVEATQDGRERASGNLVVWTIPTLAPNQQILLEGRFQAVAINPRTRVAVTVETGEGAPSNAETFIDLVAAAPQVAPTPGPILPPTQAAPGIPGGEGTPPPAPLQGAPAPVAPALPPRSGLLQVGVFGRDNPVPANTPIRYTLRILNDSDERDGQVLAQFALPPGVEVLSANPRTNPELNQFENNAGVISLPVIRSMTPGEMIDYEIVLRSNQPQTIDLNVNVRSVRSPQGVTAQARTDVQ